MTVLRVPQSTTCLAVLLGELERERVDRLRSLYEPVLGGHARARVESRANGAISVVLVGDGVDVADEVDTLAWGCPVGAEGVATDAEIGRALADPAQAAAALSGVFVLVDLMPTRVRAVTSATLPHTLRHAGGPRCEAWATRALAAHVLVGNRPTIDPEVVAEQVVLDFVVGSDELISSTRICEEATSIELSAEHATERSWYPRTHRLDRDAVATTAADLRASVERIALAFSRVPGAELALTAGRDSTLVLDALARCGVSLPTLTMGPDGYPDVVGARRLARRAGFPHRVAPPRAPEAGDALERLVSWSVWTEGMEPPTNYLTGWPDVATPGTILLTGHGGEIGRAFYWKKADAAALADPARVLLREQFGPAPEPVVAGALERLRRELATLGSGLTGPQLLDRFYATNRMRSWAGRLLPDEELAGFLPVYLEPDVVADLLHLPEDVRRSGAAFAREVDGVTPWVLARERGAHLARRLSGEVRARARRHTGSAELALLAGLVHRLAPDSITREVLGPVWYDTAVERAATNPRWRRSLWNAVGIDAAGLALRAV